MSGYTLRTEKLYRTENGVRQSTDGRIRAYKRYRGYWTVEVDGIVIGHYGCKLFYALATAERYISTGDATQVPEQLPPMSYEPLPDINDVAYRVIPPTRGGRWVGDTFIVSKSEMLEQALIRSGNAIGSYHEWTDENGETKRLRGIEYSREPVADDFPGACQPWEPNKKR